MSDQTEEDVEEEEAETEADAESETQEEVEEQEQESDGTEEPEGIQEGDFIKLEYTARTGVDDEVEERVIYTTYEDVAEESEMDTEGREFGPRTIILGEDFLFDVVEEDIIGNDVGYSNTIVVPAEEAFGEHDPDDVETVSAKKIPEDDRYPGAEVEINGRQGYLETIIGGRARVDFNHPLAGDDVTYEFEVVDVVDDRIEQVQGLIDLYTGADVEISEGTETKTTVEENDEGEEEEVEEEVETIYIEIPPQMAMNQNWAFMKQQITDDIMHRFDIERVVIRETFDHDDMHGPGMGMGMGAGAGGDVDLEDLDADELDMDEEELEEVVEQIEEAEGAEEEVEAEE
ncbi:MAG: FKBP-type peptidyl-prolyl cis-trans isomerase [Halobacteria archaeon]|nr:FKBP-type peptidyl-prolyl cis-trans isomerase [Halobacteria archaeon]